MTAGNEGAAGLAESAVAFSATLCNMTRTVSIRELRNSTSQVIAEVENGVPLTLTVNKRPVADIVPHQLTKSPWVSSDELRRIVTETPADPELLSDIAVVREAWIEDE